MNHHKTSSVRWKSHANCEGAEDFSTFCRSWKINIYQDKACFRIFSNIRMSFRNSLDEILRASSCSRRIIICLTTGEWTNRHSTPKSVKEKCEHRKLSSGWKGCKDLLGNVKDTHSWNDFNELKLWRSSLILFPFHSYLCWSSFVVVFP